MYVKSLTLIHKVVSMVKVMYRPLRFQQTSLDIMMFLHTALRSQIKAQNICYISFLEQEGLVSESD